MEENEKFKNACEKAGQDEQGFWKICPIDVLSLFSGTDIKVDCPESYDSSLNVKFRDGSKAYVANPTQAAFAAWVDLR